MLAGPAAHADEPVCTKVLPPGQTEFIAHAAIPEGQRGVCYVFTVPAGQRVVAAVSRANGVTLDVNVRKPGADTDRLVTGLVRWFSNEDPQEYGAVADTATRPLEFILRVAGPLPIPDRSFALRIKLFKPG